MALHRVMAGAWGIDTRSTIRSRTDAQFAQTAAAVGFAASGRAPHRRQPTAAGAQPCTTICPYKATDGLVRGPVRWEEGAPVRAAAMVQTVLVCVEELSTRS